MKLKKAIRVSCLVYKTISNRIMDSINTMGISDVHVQSGRVVVLKETSGILGIGAGELLDEEPSELYSFTVPIGNEKRAMTTLIEAGELSIPGRGSILAESIETTGDFRPVRGSDVLSLPSGLTGVTCIVQRGNGNAIVRAVLDMGFCVPHVTFGEGTGLRDKLGLLRITIPAEKEVVHLVVTEHDVDEVMSLLVDTGKLDQPGKGFIYTYPVSRGLLNTKLFRGKQKHAASVEQMICAIDDIKGSTEWRKRSTGIKTRRKHRKYLSDLVNLIVLCNEGRASDLVRAAMDKGAAGATVSRLHHVGLTGAMSSVSPAREMSDLAIPKSQLGAIMKALEDAGIFDERTAGIIELTHIRNACTYTGTKS
jgi:nitrogen regulatory protein PII